MRFAPFVAVGKGSRIHKNHNLRVERLSRQIGEREKKPPTPVGNNGTSPLLIAGELQKLDLLRRRGVSSQQEFERQKAKWSSHQRTLPWLSCRAFQSSRMGGNRRRP